MTDHVPLTRPEGSEPKDFHLSRRGLIGAAAVAGYALSTLPVNAQAITTGIDGLFAKDLTIVPEKPEGDYKIPTYVAMPAKPGNYPVILVVNEIFGLHEWIKDVCRRFAHQGYCAVAIDYFARYGNAAAGKDFDAVRAIVAQSKYAENMSDIRAQLNWLKAMPDVSQPKGAKPDMTRIGITGFCWGGTPVWMAAETMPEIKAGVAWYGRLEGSSNGGEVRPWPIDNAATLTKPVLGLYADGDQGISIDSVSRMNAALKASGRTPSHIELMANAKHAFFADYRPSYSAEAAAIAWPKCLDWFKTYL